MSKSHRRGPDRELPAQDHLPDREVPDAEVADLWARGNQAAHEQLGVESASHAREAERAWVERACTALRIVPREASWTERLVNIVESSALATERKETLSMRLRTDQATADEVSAAVVARLGTDSEGLRQSLLQALDHAVQHGAEGMAQHAAGRAGLPAEGVHGLLQDLVLLVAFGWDEEEEEPAAGDYAAEESGW